jgi:Ca2+-binding EF-hand superfamily protein
VRGKSLQETTNMKLHLLAGLAAAAIVGGGTALAQTAQPAAPHAAAQSHVGKAHSRADIQAHVQRMFARLDTNRDGFVTKDEAAAMKGARGDMHAMTAKGWSVERPGARDRGAMFDRLDGNRDGVITREEFANAKPRAGERRARGAGHMGGMAMMGRMFGLADANRDGKVSLQEATAAALQHFDMADLNRDGTLSPDERRQAHQRMKAQRQPG